MEMTINFTNTMKKLHRDLKFYKSIVRHFGLSSASLYSLTSSITRLSFKILKGANAYSNYRMIPRQTKLLISMHWDTMIVLDAFRYDIFESLVWKYLDGYLIPSLSAGVDTISWAKNTWRSYYNYLYLSANPIINSKVPISDFDARRHFRRIDDLWEKCWDSKLMTVNFNCVSLALIAVGTIQRFQKRYQKIIAHYIQPHAPYIGSEIIRKLVTSANELLNSFKNEIFKKELRIHESTAPLEKFVDLDVQTLVLLYLLHKFKKVSVVARIMKEAYIETAKMILKHIAEVTTRLYGKVIIVSDHGELLGEYGLFFHPSNIDTLHQRLVPFFIVK